MKADQREKTNVMRILDGKKIPYESHTYEPDATMLVGTLCGPVSRG